MSDNDWRELYFPRSRLVKYIGAAVNPTRVVVLIATASTVDAATRRVLLLKS